jgi:hypothetical protein
MSLKFSALLKRGQATRLLLALFCVLVIGVIFVGLVDLPGHILGYLATTVIFFMATRTWRSIKSFLILFAVSFFSAIFLSFFYVEVVCRLAGVIGGISALHSTPVSIIQLIITYIILFAVPVGMFIGIVGSLVLIVRRISLRALKSA